MPNLCQASIRACCLDDWRDDGDFESLKVTKVNHLTTLLYLIVSCPLIRISWPRALAYSVLSDVTVLCDKSSVHENSISRRLDLLEFFCEWGELETQNAWGFSWMLGVPSEQISRRNWINEKKQKNRQVNWLEEEILSFSVAACI